MVLTNVINPRSHIPRKHEIRSTLIGRGATVGANATIVCGYRVGCYAFIAAGCVVASDVPDYALFLGNPGRFLGWICACGIRLLFNNEEALCESCAARYKLSSGLVSPL